MSQVLLLDEVTVDLDVLGRADLLRFLQVSASFLEVFINKGHSGWCCHETTLRQLLCSSPMPFAHTLCHSHIYLAYSMVVAVQ